MRLGRSIAAAAGSVTIALIGVFLGVSPWLAGLNNGRTGWSAATKTDFWSGMGLLVVGAVTLALYQRRLARDLELAGVISRKPILEADAAEPAPAPTAEDLSDSALLALASSLLNNGPTEAMPPAPDAVPSEAGAQPSVPAVSDEALVRIAAALVHEIQASGSGPRPEPSDAAQSPKDEPPAALSEAELAHMAADLLLEIQASRRHEMALVQEENGHE